MNAYIGASLKATNSVLNIAWKIERRSRGVLGRFRDRRSCCVLKFS